MAGLPSNALTDAPSEPVSLACDNHVTVPQCHNAVQALHLLVSSVAFTITALVTSAHVKWSTMMHNKQ